LFSLTLVATLNLLAATHFHRWDLTPSQRFSLSPETLAYLGNIPHDNTTPIQLFLILPQNQADDVNRSIVDQLRTLLKEYEYEAKHLDSKYGGPVPITYAEVNPLLDNSNMQYLQELGYTEHPETLVMVVRGKRGHAITKTDLFDIATESTQGGTNVTLTAFKGENAVTSAILDVIQTKRDQIYFTVGHGEMPYNGTSFTDGLSKWDEDLTKKNFKVQPLNLATDNIPLEAKLVVVVDPYLPFAPYEIEKLRRYLDDKNGRVMLFLEPTRESGLGALLAEWGLRSEDRWIKESTRYITPDSQMLIDPTSDPKRTHRLTGSLILNGLAVEFGPTRPVEIDDKAPADDRRQVHEFLATSKLSSAPRSEDVRDPHAATLQGPFSVAALSERRSSEADDLPGGRLIVFGNSDFVTNQHYLDYGNRLLVLNCVNYLANRENMLNIAPRAPQQTKLSISTVQFHQLAWRLAVVPGLIALLGMAVYWIRNRT
jgi:ABC-type uncharacterized transport system involved in gliding motility auxiliary subunit